MESTRVPVTVSVILVLDDFLVPVEQAVDKEKVFDRVWYFLEGALNDRKEVVGQYQVKTDYWEWMMEELDD